MWYGIDTETNCIVSVSEVRTLLNPSKKGKPPVFCTGGLFYVGYILSGTVIFKRVKAFFKVILAALQRESRACIRGSSSHKTRHPL